MEPPLCLCGTSVVQRMVLLFIAHRNDNRLDSEQAPIGEWVHSYEWPKLTMCSREDYIINEKGPRTPATKGSDGGYVANPNEHTVGYSVCESNYLLLKLVSDVPDQLEHSLPTSRRACTLCRMSPSMPKDQERRPSVVFVSWAIVRTARCVANSSCSQQRRYLLQDRRRPRAGQAL